MPHLLGKLRHQRAAHGFHVLRVGTPHSLLIDGVALVLEHQLDQLGQGDFPIILCLCVRKHLTQVVLTQSVRRIEKLKELGFLPQVIEPRVKQLERRIKAERLALQ